MKTDRFSRSARAATILLAGLLLLAGAPASARKYRIPILGKVISVESPTKEMSTALAQQVEEVKTQFKNKREALHTVRGPGGKPAYLRQDVTGLITATGKNLDQAIQGVQKPGLELDALRAWSGEKMQRIQSDLAATPGQNAALFPGLDTPRAVAVVANLGWVTRPRFASTKKAAPPRQETLTADKADSILNQVGEVVSQIFVLASKDDLVVTLWVGSTPADKARFQFWPQGGVFATSAAKSIRTNGKLPRIVRGLYSYQAVLKKGSQTAQAQYPGSSDRLDLVNGTGFFCCRLDSTEQYCHDVTSEKECR